jgi:hypothetical protein
MTTAEAVTILLVLSPLLLTAVLQFALYLDGARWAARCAREERERAARTMAKADRLA